MNEQKIIRDESDIFDAILMAKVAKDRQIRRHSDFSTSLFILSKQERCLAASFARTEVGPSFLEAGPRWPIGPGFFVSAVEKRSARRSDGRSSFHFNISLGQFLDFIILSVHRIHSRPLLFLDRWNPDFPCPEVSFPVFHFPIFCQPSHLSRVQK